MAEAREELFGILDSDEMRGVPVVVIANKQDLPGELLKLTSRPAVINDLAAMNAENCTTANQSVIFSKRCSAKITIHV